MAKRILFIEPVVAHYRRDTFRKVFSDSRYRFALLAGNTYCNIRPDNTLPFVILSDYITWKIGAHRFYWLKGALKHVRRLNPDAIVCSGIDFHMIHTLAVYGWARLFRKKFFWWSHATTGNQGRFGKALRGLIYRHCCGVLAYSNRGQEMLLAMGMSRERVTVVKNALNHDDYGFDFSYSRNKGSGNGVHFLFSGRITREKRVDLLVEALAILRRTKPDLLFDCTILGGGEVERLVNLASELNIQERIRFVGPQYGNEAAAFFAQADIFLYPGGIGLSLVHALSFGLPVITTDCTDLHGPEIELLIPGINGDFFNGSAEHLAQRALQWKERLDTSADRVRENCRNSVIREGYLPESVADSIIRFLSERIS